MELTELFKNDKLFQGMIAGLMGSLAKDILSLILVLVNLKPTYFDYGEYLVFHAVNKSLGTRLVGVLVEVCFGVFLAVLYNHLKHLIQTKHPLVRGALFGSLVWFGTRSMITLFDIKALAIRSPIIPLLNISIAAVYGLVAAYALERMEKS